jgi:hypothetical protein
MRNTSGGRNKIFLKNFIKFLIKFMAEKAFAFSISFLMPCRAGRFSRNLRGGFVLPDGPSQDSPRPDNLAVFRTFP